MPLTFVHPAAVLPLMRGPLVGSALVAGALAPDIPYFLRALPVPVSAQSWWEPFFNATTTHRWPGIFTTAMVLALLLFLALASCQRPARWALPATTDPVSTGTTTGSRWLLWVVVSLALGVISHVAWDSFTHSDGWVVENVAALRTGAVGTLTWARLLQHVSTAIGLVAMLVLVWCRRGVWLMATSTARRARSLRVLALVLVPAVLASIAAVVLRYDADSGIEHLLSDAAIGAGLGSAVSAAALTVLWWVVRPDRPRATRGHDARTASSTGPTR